MNATDPAPGHPLKLLFFGHLPDLTGTGGMDWPAGDDGNLTGGALLEQLYIRWPALRTHDASLRVAVNLEYVDREAVIPPGAEVAVMPPVQGG
ncbi:MAG: Molybdopterin synthase catalytic subunit [Verrucomicrobiales bacterium]|nr:Molybdopterin synthase catalytic subunit [Verrucomicrobiales bacterium]